MKQAKRLRKLGYKVRHGKRWKKLGYKEIAALLTKAKAGAIIRSMEGKPAKTSWTVDVPARQFIGMSDDDLIRRWRVSCKPLALALMLTRKILGDRHELATGHG